jgi:hypothetical protein
MAESDRARAAFEANKARFAQRENEAAAATQKRTTSFKTWLVGAAGVIGFIISTTHALLSFSTTEDLSIVFTSGPDVSTVEGGTEFSGEANGFLINSGDEPIAFTAMGFSVHKSIATDEKSRECTKSMKDILGDPEMIKGNTPETEVALALVVDPQVVSPGKLLWFDATVDDSGFPRNKDGRPFVKGFPFDKNKDELTLCFYMAYVTPTNQITYWSHRLATFENSPLSHVYRLNQGGKPFSVVHTRKTKLDAIKLTGSE